MVKADPSHRTAHEIRENRRSNDPDISNQLLLCPECNSSEIWKNGLRYVQGKKVQRYLCRQCGCRFSKGQKKLNVISEARSLESSADLAKTAVSNGDFSIKEGFHNFPFSSSENITSHDVTIAGKQLNTFCSYNSKRQICVTKTSGAKNLVKVETVQKPAKRESNIKDS